MRFQGPFLPCSFHLHSHVSLSPDTILLFSLEMWMLGQLEEGRSSLTCTRLAPSVPAQNSQEVPEQVNALLLPSLWLGSLRGTYTGDLFPQNQPTTAGVCCEKGSCDIKIKNQAERQRKNKQINRGTGPKEDKARYLTHLENKTGHPVPASQSPGLCSGRKIRSGSFGWRASHKRFGAATSAPSLPTSPVMRWRLAAGERRGGGTHW